MDHKNMNGFNGLCRGCGGFGDGSAVCVCGRGGETPGRLADIAALVACAGATGLECIAAATLDEEVIVAMDDDGSPVVVNAGGRHGVREAEELLPPDLEIELRERFALELSMADAAILRVALEAEGWRVGGGRERRRDDALEEMSRLDAAEVATRVECVLTATVTDEEGEPYADAIVAVGADGSFLLLDEIDCCAKMPPDDGLVVLLPDRADERVAVGLTKAGYALSQPRVAMRLASGEEIVCKPPHLRGNVGTGRYAGMRAKSAMLSALEDHGPLACFEMSGVTSLRHRTLSGRLSDLQTAGLIRATGEMRDCDVTGHGQHVYELGCDPDRVGVRQTRQPSSPATPWNGGGRMGDIVDFLLAVGTDGATTSEITSGLGGDGTGVVEHGVSAATSSLKKLGVIIITGARLSEVTGRQQAVFAACPEQAARRGHRR